MGAFNTPKPPKGGFKFFTPPGGQGGLNFHHDAGAWRVKF
jgi:hypothetical protein